MLKSILKDRLLQISAVLAVLSLFLARPRLADINFSTLWSITAMMTLIQIFNHLHILDYCAYRLTGHANNVRQLVWLFLALAFASAMFLTNDVTVLTLVPLYLYVAKQYHLPEILPVTLISMTANLGSATTPFGNPHNIFLLAKFNISVTQFFKWSLPLALFSVLIIAAYTFVIKPTPIANIPTQQIYIPRRPMILAIIAALFVFAGVLDFIPAWVGAIVTIILAIALQPKIMTHVDYATILTFVGFFIIVSDLSQNAIIKETLSTHISSPLSVYFGSIGMSQFISNVPTTVLFAKFTKHAAALLYGANIGGLGTLVGSMANLLAFKQYTRYGSSNSTRFLIDFTCINLVTLVIFSLFGWWVIQ